MFRGKGSLPRISTYTVSLNFRCTLSILSVDLSWLFRSLLCHARCRWQSHVACIFLIFFMITFIVSSSVRLTTAKFWSELLLVYVKGMEEYLTNSRHSIKSSPLFPDFWTVLSGERLSSVITAKLHVKFLFTQRWESKAPKEQKKIEPKNNKWPNYLKELICWQFQSTVMVFLSFETGKGLYFKKSFKWIFPKLYSLIYGLIKICWFNEWPWRSHSHVNSSPTETLGLLHSVSVASVEWFGELVLSLGRNATNLESWKNSRMGVSRVAWTAFWVSFQH